MSEKVENPDQQINQKLLFKENENIISDIFHLYISKVDKLAKKQSL